MNLCLIMTNYHDRVFECVVLSSLPIKILFVGVNKKWNLHNKYRYTRRISHSHCGCCCPHKEMWRSTETNNTRYSHTSGKVHWVWRWDFRSSILISNKSDISVSWISHSNIKWNLIFVVPCIMLNSEIIPTRCNNCIYSSQWLYCTCFGWQFHPSSGV